MFASQGGIAARLEVCRPCRSSCLAPGRVIYEHMRREWSARLKDGRELVGWETCCVAGVCDG